MGDAALGPTQAKQGALGTPRSGTLHWDQHRPNREHWEPHTVPSSAHSRENTIWDSSALTWALELGCKPPRAAVLAGREQGQSSGAVLLLMGLIFGANKTSLGS